MGKNVKKNVTIFLTGPPFIALFRAISASVFTKNAFFVFSIG